jgi:hypothetical protein
MVLFSWVVCVGEAPGMGAAQYSYISKRLWVLLVLCLCTSCGGAAVQCFICASACSAVPLCDMVWHILLCCAVLCRAMPCCALAGLR